MADSMETEVVDIGIERKFAEVLEQAEVSSAFEPFDLIKQFRDVSSSKALQVRDESMGESSEFENWSLETKLWHLVQELYSYRVADIELVPETTFSSDATKELNYTNANKKLTELFIIRNWIQANSESIDLDELPAASKWRKTRLAVENNDFNVLNKDSAADLVNELDADAPLRLNKLIHPEDLAVDEQVFEVIYKLIIYGRGEEAITIANETGNYSLSIILIGHIRHYLLDTDIKHKLMWYQTVYELAQQTGLSKFEKLIYNYMSGSNISENLSHADNYDESLLLYCNQIIVAETVKFYHQLYPKESLGIVIPKPQISTIELILNALSRSDSKISKQSAHPIRIVAGGVMIKSVVSLITETVKPGSKIADNMSMLRILVHLSIFINLIEGELLDTADYTKLLVLYIRKLSEMNLGGLVPIYVTFIPNDIEATNCFASFLSTIRSKEDKAKQVQVCKKYAYYTSPVNPYVIEDRLSMCLKKTVERIVKKTESHYKPDLHITIQDDSASIDEVDKELSEAVDWFLLNNMHEETIVVSMIIIKRFLIVGKLAALKAFAQGKNFKQVINSYDTDLSTKRFSGEKLNSPVPVISDEEREELLNYVELINGLNSISEWKAFVEDDGKDTQKFQAKGVEHSINLVSNQILKLVLKWFVNSSDPLSKEFRKLYTPYLTIELLQIYEFSRFHNVEYLKKSFDLIKLVANEDENDLLNCFIKSGKLPEFLKRSGQVALIASENGVQGIFT